MPYDLGLKLFNQEVLYGFAETLPLAESLASAARLNRVPRVGDYILTSQRNRAHPECCTKGWNDWSLWGKLHESLKYYALEGPVLKTTIVTYPGSPAANNHLDLGAKGRGIAVALRSSEFGSKILYVNLSIDNYRTPAQFGQVRPPPF